MTTAVTELPCGDTLGTSARVPLPTGDATIDLALISTVPCSRSAAEIRGVQPGNYRLCLEATNCTPVTVAAAPATQAFTLAAPK
jgi:hypothetical protein